MARRDRQLTVFLTPEEKSAVWQAAKREGIGASTLGRECILRAIGGCKESPEGHVADRGGYSSTERFAAVAYITWPERLAVMKLARIQGCTMTRWIRRAIQRAIGDDDIYPEKGRLK